MSIPYHLIDAFTDRPFAGNPAVVCLLEAWPADDWLQRVAREMNQSETAFLTREPGVENGFRLRWFTPSVEVDLCGHATLASAHMLWTQGLAPADRTIEFSTRSGPLLARPLPGGVAEGIELDFPLKPETPTEPPPTLLAALGTTATYVGHNRMDYLVEVESPATVRGLAPDHRLLATLPVRGVIVTSRSDDSQYDFISRFFAPGSGIEEDPVTGSAHCCLADFWRKRLGKSEFVAYQASPRGGVVRVRIEGDRAILGGVATTVAKGELLASW